jgi:hypothetical protein
VDRKREVHLAGARIIATVLADDDKQKGFFHALQEDAKAILV